MTDIAPFPPLTGPDRPDSSVDQITPQVCPHCGAAAQEDVVQSQYRGDQLVQAVFACRVCLRTVGLSFTGDRWSEFPVDSS